jgi:hypothetical protein
MIIEGGCRVWARLVAPPVRAPRSLRKLAPGDVPAGLTYMGSSINLAGWLVGSSHYPQSVERHRYRCSLSWVRPLVRAHTGRRSR